MKIKNTIKKALAVLFIAVLSVNCKKVKEDNSDCGIFIRFTYTLNPDGTDKFSSSVQKLTIFVFNEAGHLVQEIEKTGPFWKDYRVQLNLPAGVYSFVVWGNLSDETPLSIGAGREMDRGLELRTPTTNLVETHPQPLFWGTAQKINVKVLNNQEVVVDMMKDTKSVKVIFHDVPASANTAGQFVCRIEAVNGDYNFQNTIMPHSRKLTYIPQRSFNNNILTNDFVTMRLFDYNAATESSLCQSRLILEYIPDDGSPPMIIMNISLTDIIKKQPEYKNANFIIDDVFILEFYIDYTFWNYTVTINGWIVSEGQTIIVG